MKKCILFGIMIISSSYLLGSSADQMSRSAERFRDLVVEALEADPAMFDRFLEDIDNRFSSDDLDVDSITLNHEQNQRTNLATLGELLDDAANEGISLGNTSQNCQLHAKIILALVTKKRSQRSISHDPFEMLRTLILHAIKYPKQSVQLPYDWSQLQPFGVYYVLMRYYRAGFFGGVYDLKKIPVHWTGGESISDYLERQAPIDGRVEIVFNLINYCDSLSSPLRHYGRTFSFGHFPKGHYVDEKNPRVAPTRLGIAPKTKNDPSQQGTSFFTTPRILMGIGVALIGGFIFYKNYYSQSKDDSNDSVNRGSVGSVAIA